MGSVIEQRHKTFEYINSMFGFFFSFLQLSTTRTMQTSVSISQIMKEKEVFHDVLPGIIENLQASSKISQQPEVAAWIKQVCFNYFYKGKLSNYIISKDHQTTTVEAQ